MARPDINSALWIIRDLVTSANSSIKTADLVGEPRDVKWQLKQLARIRREALIAMREVKEIRDHSHRWNRHDYCDVCGADGRA